MKSFSPKRKLCFKGLGIVLSFGAIFALNSLFSAQVSAAGTAEMEQTILSSRNVPDAEIQRIANSGEPTCETQSIAGSLPLTYCTERYPGGTTVSFERRTEFTQIVVTIRDKDGNEISTGSARGDENFEVRDAETGQTISERENPVPPESGCGVDPICHLAKLPGMFLTGIAMFLLMLAGMILFAVGTVFNFVVTRTIFEFGTYFGTSDGMLLAWSVVRDIANIGLLFGFIFLGVLLILNVDGGGHGHGHGGISARRAIPRLIIFAILLNFSLFASQAIIDVANAFSASFANIARQGECSTDVTTQQNPSTGQSLEDCATNVGISGRILQVAGVSSIFSTTGDLGEAMKNLIGRPYSYAVSLIMLTIFVIVTALVLLAGAIMLIIRVVVLSFLMVTSPIGFAAMALPKLESIGQRWWSALISQSFFAPVYLLLILISIKLTEGLMDGEATLANAVIANEGTGVTGNMQVVMVFLIVIGFMIASLMAASKMGAMGASFATNSASALTFGAMTRGTNLAAGVAGVGLSRVARRGLRPGDSISGNRLRLERMGNALQKGNFDLRRAPLAGSALGIAGITAGAKPAEHASLADMRHQFDDIKSGKGGQKAREEAEQRIKTRLLEDAAHNGELNDDPALSDEQRAQRAANRQFLASLSAKELEQLHGIKEGVEALAENLSPEQFEALMKSDKLSDSEKGKLKGARFAGLNRAIQSGDTAAIKDRVKAMTKKDLENMPPDMLTNPGVIAALSDKQRDDLSGSEKLSAAQRTAIKGSYSHTRINEGIKAGSIASADIKAQLDTLNPDQIAKLDAEVLAKPDVARHLSPAMLASIARANKLNNSQIESIKSQLVSRRGSEPAIDRYLSGPGGALWGV